VQVLFKVALSVAIILVATAIAKRLPGTAGLIGVMPLTGALVLVWVYLENEGDPALMQRFAIGALWGIWPSILFFLAALVCFYKQMPLPYVVAWSFGAWLVGAAVHQLLLK
jgi:uncharacterized membrane protein (GlpM family)